MNQAKDLIRNELKRLALWFYDIFINKIMIVINMNMNEILYFKIWYNSSLLLGVDY